MSRGQRKLPQRVVTPRRHVDLNRMQMAFVVEYLKDYDHLRAFRAAGYRVADKDNELSSIRRMMRKPHVMQMINDAQTETMKATGITRENTVLRLHLEYLEAREDGDHAVAIKALVEIGKILGVYEVHNRQKTAYTMDDVERLKKELGESGFDLDSFVPSQN